MEKDYKDIPFFRALISSLRMFITAVILAVLYLKAKDYFDPYFMTKDEFRDKDAMYKVNKYINIII